MESSLRKVALLTLSFLAVLLFPFIPLAFSQTTSAMCELPELPDVSLSRAAKKGSSDFDPIYTYDASGNRTSMIDPTGITTYTYDGLNRLISITNNRGLTTTFAYDSPSRRTSMTHANGVVTTYEYDKASQITRIVHQKDATTINSFSYSYDRVGNVITKLDRNGTYNYTYDKLNRLVQGVTPLPSNSLETYTYDSVGNRASSNQNGPSIFNAGNQLTEDNAFLHQYDNNGNLTRKTAKATGEITTYEYDAENQLVLVVRGDTRVIYKYDGTGRRVENEVSQAGVTKTTRFIFDREDILLELDSSNNITARYTHGPGFDEPLILEKSGQSFFFHTDILGSVTDITDINGVVVKSYTYSSFGKIETETNPSFLQPYTFTGREFDPETGLYYYRARYYDSSTGRFISTDRIPGLLTQPSTQHPYVYALNNPQRIIDPEGTIPLIIPILLIGGVYGSAQQAIPALLQGQSLADVAAQAAIGFAGGAGGALAGTVTALATKNPYLTGGAANATFGQITSLLQGQGVSPSQAIVDFVVGAAIGQMAHKLIPGVPGPEPNLFRWRPLSAYGPKSLRTLREAALGGLLELEADWFQGMLCRP